MLLLKALQLFLSHVYKNKQNSHIYVKKMQIKDIAINFCFQENDVPQHVKCPALLLDRYTSGIFLSLDRNWAPQLLPTSSTRDEALSLLQLLAKQVAVKEMPIFFLHQQKRQVDFVGTHWLISTNLVLLPAVFLSQADSMRLSIWLTGYFILINSYLKF